MTRLRVVSFRKMDRLLRNLGFEAVRRRGSHVFYRHPDGRTTTLPDHAGRDLARPLIREVLREIEVSVEECARLLEEG